MGNARAARKISDVVADGNRAINWFNATVATHLSVVVSQAKIVHRLVLFSDCAQAKAVRAATEKALLRGTRRAPEMIGENMVNSIDGRPQFAVPNGKGKKVEALARVTLFHA